jgi:Ser/Thr protein kinase RdoA (MazF antagonist)
MVRCGLASSNIVCRVIAGAQTYYLRCNHESERTSDDYAAEMAFVEHLAAQGVRVVRPVPSQAGALVEQVPA